MRHSVAISDAEILRTASQAIREIDMWEQEIDRLKVDLADAEMRREYTRSLAQNSINMLAASGAEGFAVTMLAEGERERVQATPEGRWKVI